MVKRHYENHELLKYTEREPNLTSFEDKELLLHLDSFCLGDTICFASFLDPFVEFHKPKKVLVSTFFPHLLHSTNPIYEFINANQSESLVIDKLIDVGYNKSSMSHTVNGMFYAAKDTMFLPQSTKPGKCPVIPKVRNPKINKITIGPESVKKISQWNYPNGWQTIVDKLNDDFFEVYNVSYEDTLNLKNVKGFHGFDNLNVALNHILESRFFIGLSSGLSWLAWAYDVPVVMISNFTKEHNEFKCYRVKNTSVCNGCFNTFKNIKTHCPLFLGTDRENECHNKITPEMVMEQINKATLFTIPSKIIY